MIENLVPRVNVLVETFDAETGELLHSQETHNLVVTAGLNLIRDALNGGTIDPISHFAVGTGSTAVTAGDTELDTEVEREVVTAKTTGSASLVIQYYLASGTANGNTLAEAGLFNDATAGDMYARVVLGSTIAKTAAVAVSFTWTLTWGAV